MTHSASDKSKCLSESKMRALAQHMPGATRLSKWSLLYTPSRDGSSYLSFFKKLDDNEQTILVIKDTGGFVFGAFLSEEWRCTSDFYGNGLSFVFSFRDGEDLEIYRATGLTDKYLQSDEDGVIVGGGKDASQRASLVVSDSFSWGHSGASSTYDNCRLCSWPQENSLQKEGDFTVNRLEVWGFS